MLFRTVSPAPKIVKTKINICEMNKQIGKMYFNKENDINFEIYAWKVT